MGYKMCLPPPPHPIAYIDTQISFFFSKKIELVYFDLMHSIPSQRTHHFMSKQMERTYRVLHYVSSITLATYITAY